jgi:hypothetical protein
MIFIDAIEIDERLASHFAGPGLFLRDHLTRFRFSEFSITASSLTRRAGAVVVVVVSHGS